MSEWMIYADSHVRSKISHLLLGLPTSLSHEVLNMIVYFLDSVRFVFHTYFIYHILSLQ